LLPKIALVKVESLKDVDLSSVSTLTTSSLFCVNEIVLKVKELGTVFDSEQKKPSKQNIFLCLYIFAGVGVLKIMVV
jgi:hypothetical protein